MPFWVVIPARYASSRLPGKLLLDIAGKPLLQHVFERSVKSGAQRVIIATDDERIVKMAKDISAEVELTSPSHQSGTDRIAEVMRNLKVKEDTLIVNVQGDEPMIDPAIIRQVAELLQQDQQASMATLASPVSSAEEIFNPNCVKVVMDKFGYAMYFSRASIPWDRAGFPAETSIRDGLALEGLQSNYFRHIGLYAYRANFLETYINLQPAPQEKLECLEQNRVLYHGYKVRVDLATADQGVGVDTEKQYRQVKKLMENN